MAEDKEKEVEETEQKPRQPEKKENSDHAKLWIYAFAFAIMCFIYAGCKLAGLEWAASRSWWEVGAWVGVAVLIIVAFIFRKTISRLFSAIKEKIRSKRPKNDD